MQAIKRQNRNGGEPLRLQDTAIKGVLNIPQDTTRNNSKCTCKAPCKQCKCKMPRLNPLSVIALTRYRDELTRLEVTREISGLVDCCNVLLQASKGAL